MNCIYCKKRIVLVPSAAQRAKKFGGTPQQYESLFTSHPECAFKERERQTSELMKRLRNV